MQNQTRRVVWVGDPALDVATMKIRGEGGYAETRDESLVRERPGMRAHRFVIRPLTPRESILVDERASVLRAARMALSIALVEVQLPSGESLVPKERVQSFEGTGEQSVWSDNALDMLVRKFGKACLLDIATLIREVDEQPGEAFASGDGVRFKLLPSSLDALEQMERRLAASTPSTRETPSSEPSSPT